MALVPAESSGLSACGLALGEVAAQRWDLVCFSNKPSVAGSVSNLPDLTFPPLSKEAAISKSYGKCQPTINRSGVHWNDMETIYPSCSWASSIPCWRRTPHLLPGLHDGHSGLPGKAVGAHRLPGPTTLPLKVSAAACYL